MERLQEKKEDGKRGIGKIRIKTEGVALCFLLNLGKPAQ